MPARRRAGPQDAVHARRILLGGLARDARIVDLASELAPLHLRGDTFPGEVFLDLGAGALGWRRASLVNLVASAGHGSGSFRSARFVAARSISCGSLSCGSGGSREAQPDLPDVVAWWQADDFWRYALFAAVPDTRAAADRVGVPARRVCRELAQRDGRCPPDATGSWQERSRPLLGAADSPERHATQACGGRKFGDWLPIVIQAN